MEIPSGAHRKSHVGQDIIYFWTATINGWKHLLENNTYKDIVLDALRYLSDAGKVDVFAFIIMPNHIHLIWRVIEANGKESPPGSLLKYTAHAFQRRLRQEEAGRLAAYRVEAANKRYEFWQRDALAIPLFSREVAVQKLTYLHHNPLAEHWGLVKDPCDYVYSSARYYERNEKAYPFLKNLWEAIG